MEVVLTSVPIPVEATSVHVDMAMNSREKVVRLGVMIW